MESNRFENMSLLEFIPAISPQMKPPYHLEDLCNEFHKIARGERVRLCCAYPIRHWKTQTMLHGIAWLLTRFPKRRYLLFTHSHTRATWLGKRLRQLCEAAGVGPDKGFNTIEDWSNAQGGGAIVMSAEQSKLGYDVHGVFADDPVDENAVRDWNRREAVDEAIAHYTARCMFEGQPGPVVLVMSRWSRDDPIARRIARGWAYLSHPVIENEGTPEEKAFAPDVWDLPALKEMRAEAYERDPSERFWLAQFMCNPAAEGTSGFGQPEKYVQIPPWNYRIGYGIDMAFTMNDGSDFFAIAVGKVLATRLYLLEVKRERLDPYLAEQTCKAMQNKYGRGPFFSYMSGPEKGFVRQMHMAGIALMPMPARYNKLVRAEQTKKRWNAGQIVVPEVAPWLNGFLVRVSAFTGADKGHDDDEIDAVVSLADGMFGSAVAGGPKTIGKAYPGM